jgi:cytochrome b
MMNPPSDTASSPPDGNRLGRRILVWDIPTRLFHWLLVALVTVSFVTGKIGPTAMHYHEYSGVAILMLVLFRCGWGFVGSEPSRFRSFLRGPSAVIRYASTLFQRRPARHLGHNPLGGWSVILLLICLLVQAGTGLFANDDILTEGPLFDWISKDASDWLTGIHHLNRSVLVGLITIHVGAVLFYLIYKKENLIFPMITGFKTWHADTQVYRRNGWVAIGLAAALAVAVYIALYRIG